MSKFRILNILQIRVQDGNRKSHMFLFKETCSKSYAFFFLNYGFTLKCNRRDRANYIYIAFMTEWPFLVSSLSSVHFVKTFVLCVVVTQYKTVSQTEKPTQAYTFFFNYYFSLFGKAGYTIVIVDELVSVLQTFPRH